MIRPARVRVVGPLAPYARGFRAELARQGYRPESAGEQLLLMAHLSRWLAGRDLDAGELSAIRVEQFLRERREEGRAHLRSARALSPLLGHLRSLGVVRTPSPAVAVTPLEALLERYSVYLLEERGLSPSSVRNYVGVARLFLADRVTATGALELEGLTAAAVSAFVLGECRRCSVGSAKCTVSRLRSLLRFLHVEGRTGLALAAAVPSVASWRLASLPKAIDTGAVARLLGSCDRRSSVGRRDFAILTLLLRLGLRAGEVAAVQLADIDWRQGELAIRGKGNREERLPLPADVGEAVVGWLRRGGHAARARTCSHGCARRSAVSQAA